MKHYLIEPKWKKSVVEISYYEKVIDGITVYATREEGYRWGSFVVHVESDDELPDPEDDAFWLENYDYEMIDVWDGCWCYWEVEAGDDPEGKLDLESIENSLDENGADEDDGWVYGSGEFSIQGEFIMKECDETGVVL